MPCNKWSKCRVMEAIWAWLEPWSEPRVCANKTSVDLPSLRKTVLFLAIYPRNCIWNIGTILNDCCSRFCGILCIFSKAQKNCFKQKGVVRISVAEVRFYCICVFMILYLKIQWQIWIKMVSEDWTGKTVVFLCCKEQNFSLKGMSHGLSIL